MHAFILVIKYSFTTIDKKIYALMINATGSQDGKIRGHLAFVFIFIFCFRSHLYVVHLFVFFPTVIVCQISFEGNYGYSKDQK